MEIAIISLAILFFIGHALGWFFEKTKIPDLLILMIIGYVMGPILGFLTEDAFGQSGALISTIALVVILYQGGLSLTAKQLKESFFSSSVLSLLSFFSIVILTFLVSLTIGGQSITIALLTSVGVGSTSSAIVIPMVKSLSIKENTKAILSLESAFTDVLAIVIFLVLVDGIQRGIFSASELLIQIGPNTLLAMFMGVISAFVWSLLKKQFAPVFKMAFAGECWALLTYGAIQLGGYNGAIGVLALGFVLANLDLLPEWLKNQLSSEPVSHRELALLNELIFILKTFFFIYLGVLIKFEDTLAVVIAVIISFLIFLTRYFIAKFLFSKEENKLEPMIITAMGPRGLACAVLATIPVQQGIANGHWVQSTVFAVIPISIFITAVMVASFENKKSREILQKFW